MATQFEKAQRLQRLWTLRAAPAAVWIAMAACGEPTQKEAAAQDAVDGAADGFAFDISPDGFVTDGVAHANDAGGSHDAGATVPSAAADAGASDAGVSAATDVGVDGGVDAGAVAGADAGASAATDAVADAATGDAAGAQDGAYAVDAGSTTPMDALGQGASDSAGQGSADTGADAVAPASDAIAPCNDSAGAGGNGDASAGQDAAANAAHPPLPTQPAAPDAHGLTNVSTDLWALLEKGTLKGSCATYEALGAQATQAMKVKCGKELFFYEHWNTYGPPRAIVDYLNHNLPKTVGTGMTHFGLYKDPTSWTQLPVGMAVGADLKGMQTYAYTCASCHFGKTPDGRFSVGQPNHDFDYGRQLLVIQLFPGLAMGTDKVADVHPDAMKVLSPVLDEFKAIPNGMFGLGLALLPLLSQLANVPKMALAIQAQYASWPAGTQDFMVWPVPLDDNVHIVSKIQSLWQLPTQEEVAQHKMPHKMLGSAGTTATLHNFFAGFSVLSGGNSAAPYKAEALRAYLHTLVAPTNPTPPPAAEVQGGAKLFVSKGCTDCHSGPRHAGTSVYSFAEIGTDDALALWNDGNADGKPDHPLMMPGDSLTGGVKSPRLTGLWAQKRLLHNGALKSLEELFCTNGPRPGKTPKPMSDAGHLFTCEGLTPLEKTQLMAYLRSI